MIFSPGVKVKFALAEMHGLRSLADQVHLDPVRFLVVDGAMPPPRKIEIRPQLAVRTFQHVEIEGRGHARAVIVSRFQYLA